jgi:hypothetical protein
MAESWQFKVILNMKLWLDYGNLNVNQKNETIAELWQFN